MDVNAFPVSPDDLYTRLGTSKAPLLIDVRRREAFDADKTLIIGAARRLPDDVSEWRKTLPRRGFDIAKRRHGGHLPRRRHRRVAGAEVADPAKA